MHHYNTSLDGYTLTSKGLAHLEVLLCCHDMHTTLHTCCTPCSEGVPDGSRRAPEGLHPDHQGDVGIRITPPTPLNDTFRGVPSEHVPHKGTQEYTIWCTPVVRMVWCITPSRWLYPY